MTRKTIFIEEAPHPWIVWDKDMYTQSNKDSFFPLKVVTSFNECDIYWANTEMVDPRKVLDKLGDRIAFFYYKEIPPAHELTIIDEIKTIMDDDRVHIVVESRSAFDKISGVDPANKPWLWHRPHRISEGFMNVQPLNDIGPTFVSCLDAGHPLSCAADLVKAFLGATAILDDEWDIIPDLDIFSATELPFEPFNNIKFNGLAPTNKYLRFLPRSRVFVDPSRNDLFPKAAVEAAIVGVLPLVRDTEVNREVFGPDDYYYFNDVEELTSKMIQLSELEPTEDKQFKNARVNTLLNVWNGNTTQDELCRLAYDIRKKAK